MSTEPTDRPGTGLLDEPTLESGALAGSAAVGQLARSARSRRQRARAGGRLLISTATLIVLFVTWTLLTTRGVVSDTLVPSPSQLFDTFKTLFSDGYQGTPIWEHLGKSLQRSMVGFVIGTSLGLVVGLAIGTSIHISAALSPIFAFLRPIPPIAYLPLMVVIFGIGEKPKIILIASGAFFYMALHTAAGARGVPEELRLTGRMLGLNRRQIFTNVIFRAALPTILIAVNFALILSWAIVVAAELVSSAQGIGYVATDAATFFRIPYIYAAVIMIGLVGAILEAIMRIAEWRLLRWRR